MWCSHAPLRAEGSARARHRSQSRLRPLPRGGRRQGQDQEEEDLHARAVRVAVRVGRREQHSSSARSRAFFAVDPGRRGASNVNAFDEVADSAGSRTAWARSRTASTSWRAGPAATRRSTRAPPDGSWLIDQGKPNGANPGFRVNVPGLGKFMLKADPAGEARARHRRDRRSRRASTTRSAGSRRATPSSTSSRRSSS